MSKRDKIPVHRMDDWFSGVYIKAMDTGKSSRPDYERSLPHRHDFYYCVVLDKGHIELEVDFEKIQLTDQTLFLSYPGQVHQVNSAFTTRGWFLAFDPAMLDEQLKNVLDQCLSEIILVPLAAAQSDNFVTFIQQLHMVYTDEALLFRQTIVKAMVTAFVYQVAAAYLSIEKVALFKHPARSIEITKRFRQLLRREYKAIRKPSDYAAKMNMTTSHLNDTVRAVTGFPVTWYIQQELMREAQRLLYYSDLTVKEIALQLGFEDDKYFNRLFSKVTGTSPGAFRKGI